MFVLRHWMSGNVMFEARYCRSLYHTFSFLNAASPLKCCNTEVCSTVTGPLSEPQIAYTCREMLQVRSPTGDFDTFVTEVSLLIIWKHAAADVMMIRGQTPTSAAILFPVLVDAKKNPAVSFIIIAVCVCVNRVWTTCMHRRKSIEI